MSTLEPKDEYKSLRDEILHRFQKIYDAEKYGIGSIVILIGYFLTTTIENKEFYALLLLQSLVLLLGIFVMYEFMMIYRLGTYIALFIEGVASAKWHRISRRTL